ncbi:hypothetical protein RHOSPDRAFT_33533 [Rhodotorula sp. JG-1b]|nr:hypothetical protein RHOSPDRAFT_33533 [Rhodotorula sp. JG-1b]
MDSDHVELQSYRGRASVAPPLDQTHRAAAARLVKSCLAGPYKLHKGEPWPRDPPIKPHPCTVWYETTSAPPPPPPLAAALTPSSASPERTSASNRTQILPDLPDFQHWRHLDPSTRSGSTRPKRDEHWDAALVSAPSANVALPSQGLLRRRPPPAVAGAWAPTSGSSALLPQGSAHDASFSSMRTTTAAAAVSSGGASDRTPGQKKQVRVESPRTTAARTATASATALLPSSSRSPRRGATSTTTTTESAAASRRDQIVPVPRSGVRPRPSSENDGDDGGGGTCSAATGAATSSRGVGAIERCIPPPYAHRILDPLLNPSTDTYDLNPARQEPSAVLHSFVDPDYARNRRRILSGEAGTGEVAPELPLSSPATMEFLAPGRRGAWLIPISEGEGPVPPFTSPAIWPAGKTLPPASRSSGSRAVKTTTTRKARLIDGEGPAGLPLEWTDARLVVLWIYLTSLHEGRGFGNIRAQAISGRGGGGSSSSTTGDVLKINCDAHLALAIRGLLDRLNVKGVAKRVGGGGDGGPANEKLQRLKREGACTDDDEKWFKGRALVWVDEQSRAILTA